MKGQLEYFESFSLGFLINPSRDHSQTLIAIAIRSQSVVLLVLIGKFIKMSCLRTFLEVSVIIYALFLFYLSGDTIYFYATYNGNDLSLPELTSEVAQIAAQVFCGVLLIVGAVKSGFRTLAVCLILFIFKTSWILLHLKKFIEIMFNCEESDVKVCPSASLVRWELFKLGKIAR